MGGSGKFFMHSGRCLSLFDDYWKQILIKPEIPVLSVIYTSNSSYFEYNVNCNKAKTKLID